MINFLANKLLPSQEHHQEFIVLALLEEIYPCSSFSALLEDAHESPMNRNDDD
jgi:hypothetical protein